MSVKVSSNTIKILTDIDQGVPLALRWMLEDIQLTADPRTPKDKGNLRRDTLISVLGRHGAIKWQKDYAVYQETKQYRNYTTPGTGPHFAETAVKKIVNNSDSYFRRARLIP